MKIVSGSSNQSLSKEISQAMDIPLLDVEITNFANGEKRVWVKEKVRGEDIILVQSFSRPADEHIMELLLLVDALERYGANDIIIAIPWMGYSFQDKVFREGEPIAAKVVANLISTAHVKKVFLLDLHNTSIPGFFSVPTEHISAIEIFIKYSQENFKGHDLVVASPDFGGLKRARVFADALGVGLVNIDKERDLETGQVTATQASGAEIKGRTVLIFDDAILSGGTVVETAKLLKKNGAKEVHFLATHGILTSGAEEKIVNSEVDSVVITNTVEHPGLDKKIKIIDCSPVFVDKLKD